MRFERGRIILRDMKEEDIDDYIKWFVDDGEGFTEWMNYDAPWEDKISSDCDEERASWTEYYLAVKDYPDSAPRWKFEIEVDGKHIGWVSAYDDLEYVENPDNTLAIGIDIPEKQFWGNGIGTEALSMFIDYYRSHGVEKLYIQTWSGNERMMRVIEKLGFREYFRKKNYREVNGRKYDAVTFILCNKSEV